MFGSFGLNSATLKATLKKYGRTGLVTYLGLSSMVTTGFYIAIERNIDVKKIVGIEDDVDPDASPSLMQQLLLGPGSHLALAVLCSKACIPLKLPVAVALTPYVHRLEQRYFQRYAQRTAMGAQQQQQQQRQQQQRPPDLR